MCAQLSARPIPWSRRSTDAPQIRRVKHLATCEEVTRWTKGCEESSELEIQLSSEFCYSSNAQGRAVDPRTISSGVR